MSRIYFHSIEDEAAVRGSERAHFGMYCRDIALLGLSPILTDTPDAPSPFRQAVPDGHYLRLMRSMDTGAFDENSPFREAVRQSLMMPSYSILVRDERISPWLMTLNTALANGSDPVRLAARLHGQCEIHAYVEGENRRWLAGIIRAGRNSGFYRSGMGWESVIDLLEATNHGPVVTSYSVCEQFPNQSLDESWDEQGDWYQLPVSEQWDRALTGLRGVEGLELRPDNFTDLRFGDGITAHRVSELLGALTVLAE